MSRLLRYLDWEKKLTGPTTGPAHFDFFQKDARAFLTTLYGASGFDLFWDNAADPLIQARSVDVQESLLDHPHFPVEALFELNQLEDSIQNRVRTNFRRVITPTDRQGKLDGILPIEVLEHLLEKAGRDWLYSSKAKGWLFWSEEDFNDASASKTAINNAIEPLAEWLIVDDNISSDRVFWDRCRYMSVIIYNEQYRRAYRKHLAITRNKLIQTWNNRRASRS